MAVATAGAAKAWTGVVATSAASERARHQPAMATLKVVSTFNVPFPMMWGARLAPRPFC